MAFCSYCGQELAPGARFCSSCGSPAAAEAIVPAPETAPAEPIPVIDASAPADYSVVLYSIGTCAKSYADDVLEDILGYTDSEAKQILRTTPTQIAQYLTMAQAQTIAQALTEYGMQVVIYKGQQTVDLGQYATASVFNSDGSFVTAALAALAGITVANRVRSIRRWSLTNILSHLFTPRYRPAPPRHVTRAPIRREPTPAPRRMETPRSPKSEPRKLFGAGTGGARGRTPNGGGRMPGGSPRGMGGRGGMGGPGGRR